MKWDYLRAGAAAVLVTGLLFRLMLSLIDFGLQGEEDVLVYADIDFMRVMEDSDANTKDRKLPKKVETKTEPPPPDIDIADTPLRPGMQNLNAPGIPLQQGADLTGLGFGGMLSDSDVLPLVRVEPIYPRRANERGIEGWVYLRFTITTAGTVRDPIVVDADPANVFDRAATRAVLKWKYKPKMVDGKPVEQSGIEVVMTFELEE
jgi:protein TonB